MSITALLVAGFIDLAMGPAKPIVCDFRPAEPGATPLSVMMTPVPSLKDKRAVWRVKMELTAPQSTGTMRVRAAAKPIDKTSARDVLIRGISRSQTRFTVGLRDDGMAALSIVRPATDSRAQTEETRVGHCQNYQPHIGRWLTS